MSSRNFTRRASGHLEGPQDTTQAGYIAGQLYDAALATKSNKLTDAELLRKQRSRVTLAYFSFEQRGAHSYRPAAQRYLGGMQ